MICRPKPASRILTIDADLTSADIPLFAYEDCPYAIHTLSGLDVRLAQIPCLYGSMSGVDGAMPI